MRRHAQYTLIGISAYPKNDDTWAVSQTYQVSTENKVFPSRGHVSRSHTRTRIHVHIPMHVRTHEHTHTHAHTHTPTHTHTHTPHTFTYIHTRTHAKTLTNPLTLMHACAHSHTDTYSLSHSTQILTHSLIHGHECPSCGERDCGSSRRRDTRIEVSGGGKESMKNLHCC